MEMLRVFITEMGFQQSKIDYSVLYRWEGKEHTIVAVVTDDMAVTSRRKQDAEMFKSKVKSFWDITNHGPINWFLGFEIRRDQKARTLSINQCLYIELLVEKFRLTGAKKVSTPMDPNVHFSVQQCPSSSNQVNRMRGVP